MGKLDRFLLGEAYDRLVLPPPKGSVIEFCDEIKQMSPSSGKNVFYEIFPRYKRIADQIEKFGYLGISNLVQFCFNETSEYFTRTITDKNDDQTVIQIVGDSLDLFTIRLVDALINRSKPDVISSIARIYQTLAPKSMVTGDRKHIGTKIAESLENLKKGDMRPIRKVLSTLSCQTYTDEDLTLSINYLNSVFNKDLRDLRGVGTCKEIDNLIKYLSQWGKAIQEKNELGIYHAIESIANLAYQFTLG